MACIYDYVDSLPQKHKTIIGSLGNNISTGQKQRILIARAIYKNPKYSGNTLIYYHKKTDIINTSVLNDHTLLNKTVLVCFCVLMEQAFQIVG